MDINRKTAYSVLLAIEKEQAYSNLELNRQIGLQKPEDPAFVRELVYGVLENRIYLDYILEALIPKGLKGIRDRVLTLLRMGLYQMICMDSVPEYAAVSETVRLAKKEARGREGFVNGVLRGYGRKKEQIRLPDAGREPVRYLSVKYSFAEWIVRLWIGQYGMQRTEALLAASNSRPPLSIRVNLTKTTRKELEDELENLGFQVTEGKLSSRILFVSGSGLLDTDSYRQGKFSVQDQASALAAEMLDPKPGETVLDICAAPGGKSLAMAEIMENKGLIRAFDIYSHKLELMKSEAQRLGLSIIEVSSNDGTVFREDLEASADRVLVDGPCSGLGVIRRKPEIKYRAAEDDGRELAEKQLAILRCSSRYVRPGGRLLYSTCTINRTENEDVVRRFLEENDDFEMSDSRQLLPDEGETDGFFICVMQRKGC
ncbi:MAG: 16S rRNA (cytosine(967)-C(5))-methyltransferase RsmB [Emergencia sp.]